MSSVDQVRGLMVELGPLADLAAVTEYLDQKIWTIAVDEEILVIAELDEEAGRLVLSGEIGRPAEDDRLYWYDLLLHYNLHWSDTGGVRMALDEPGGAVTQLFDQSLHDLDVARLQAVVGSFVDVLRTWRAALAQTRPSTSQPFDPMTTGIIRA